MRRITPLLTTALLAAALGAIPAPAHASRSQESLFQDDANLLFTSDARRNATLNELRALGVDVIRLNVVWNQYAPAPQSKKKPSFDATNPGAYRNLNVIDSVVAGARARGMTVQLTPTVPGPAWASGCKGSANSRRICKPKAAEYGRFVKALGRHYGTVHRWSFMNEENLGAWLTPQWQKHGKTWIRQSPIIYRGLVRAATAALAASGHGGDLKLLGETAPIGRTRGSRYKRSVGPVDFYRELFCLDSKGRKLRGRAAKVRGCSSFKRLDVTGVAHHPYTQGAGKSPRSRVGRSDITLRYISRLSTWLNRGAKRGRIRKNLPIYLTESGFQTNPPDRFAGTSLSNQARWLNQYDWMAWRNKRIRSVAQYELRDERPRAAFQTGLRFAGGKAKPGLAAYRLPIWPDASRKYTRIWLQVRPAARLPKPQRATIQFRKKGAKKYKTLKSVNVSDRHGFLYFKTRTHAQYWRVLWNGAKSRAAKPV